MKAILVSAALLTTAIAMALPASAGVACIPELPACPPLPRDLCAPDNPAKATACVSLMGDPDPNDPPTPRVDLNAESFTIGIHIEGKRWGLWIIIDL